MSVLWVFFRSSLIASLKFLHEVILSSSSIVSFSLSLPVCFFSSLSFFVYPSLFLQHIRVLQIYVMCCLLSKLQEEAARTDEKEEEEEEDRKFSRSYCPGAAHHEEGSKGEGVEEESLCDETTKKKKKRKRSYPPVILCGDFNCQPGSGGLRLLKEKQVDRFLDDWTDGESLSLSLHTHTD